MLASHCPISSPAFRADSSVRVPSVPFPPPTKRERYPTRHLPQKGEIMTTNVPTLPVLPSRHADAARIQTQAPAPKRDESRPYYTQDEQDKVWTNLQAMFGAEITKFVEVIGDEEQAKKLVLGRYERVHQWVSMMIRLLEFDVGLAHTESLENIRKAAVAKARQQRDLFYAEFADASKRPGNRIAYSDSGMGRAKRTTLFGWMARIDARLCERDGQTPREDMERILMGSRDVSDEDRQNWFSMVSDYLFFIQNLYFLVFKHWEKKVKDAGENVTDEMKASLVEAKGGYEAYRNALLVFKKQMFKAGQEDRIAWLERAIDDKRTSESDRVDYRQQLAKLQGGGEEEQPADDATDDAATGTEG